MAAWNTRGAARSAAPCLVALAALLLAGCAGTPGRAPGPKSLLIVNAGGPGPVREVLVRGNRIAEVGAGLRSRAPDAEVLDAHGGLVLPGFHDAHIHLLDGGLAMERVDLDGIKDLGKALAAVRAFAEAHPREPWVLGRGWAYELAPAGSFPLAAWLDSAVPDRPAALESYDGHAFWANTKALELAGIGAATRDPEGGRIVRGAGGAPAGVLLEDAIALLADALPKPGQAERRAAMARGLRRLLELGVTSIETIEEGPAALEDLAALQAQGRLHIRVAVVLPLQGDLEAYSRLREAYDSPFLRLGHLKGFVDGVVEARTAYMLEPYPGSTGRGEPLLAPEALKDLAAAAQCRGFGVALHAVGDAAIRLSLDAFEAARKRCPAMRARHRIEHVEVAATADLPRFKALDVVASMQPLHAEPASPDPDAGAWAGSLDADRRARGFAWRALLDRGATLAFGSDWPVVSPDPLAGLAVAVSRRGRDGRPEAGWNVGQALAPDEALAAYGRGPAYSLGLESELGTLAPGMLADLVVLDTAVRLDDPASLWKGGIRRVIVDGVPAVEPRRGKASAGEDR